MLGRSALRQQDLVEKCSYPEVAALRWKPCGLSRWGLPIQFLCPCRETSKFRGNPPQCCHPDHTWHDPGLCPIFQVIIVLEGFWCEVPLLVFWIFHCPMCPPHQNQEPLKLWLPDHIFGFWALLYITQIETFDNATFGVQLLNEYVKSTLKKQQ